VGVPLLRRLAVLELVVVLDAPEGKKVLGT